MCGQRWEEMLFLNNSWAAGRASFVEVWLMGQL